MHLFPDADENLSTIYPDYPLANVLVCFGIILVLSIDQIATTLWRRLHPTQINRNGDLPHDAKAANIVSLPDHSHDQDQVHPYENSDLRVHPSPHSGISHNQDHDHESHHENCGFMTCEHHASAGNKGTQEVVVESRGAQSLPFDLGVAAQALIQEDSFKDIVAAYIMEFSIAAHSIIIGVNLGLLGEDDISSIVALMIALGFHQVLQCL